MRSQKTIRHIRKFQKQTVLSPDCAASSLMNCRVGLFCCHKMHLFAQKAFAIATEDDQSHVAISEIVVD